jgi:tetratricopeptide (TPR) repeat protein
MASDYYEMGALSEYKGDYEKAMGLYDQCKRFATKSNSELELAKAIMGKGRVFAQKGFYQKSIKQLKRAVEIFEKHEIENELPMAYTCLGSSAFYIDINEALQWHERCIKVSEKTGNVRMQGYGLSNKAGCLIEKAELNRAERCLDKAMPIFKGIKEKIMISSILSHYANIYRLRRKWSEALEYSNKSIKIAKSFGAPTQIADSYHQRGLILKDKSDYPRAKHCLNMALEIFSDLNEFEMIKETKNELAELKHLQKSRQLL